MTATKTLTTIRHKLILNITFVVLALLIASFYFIHALFVNYSENSIKVDLESRASIMATRAISFIETNDSDGLKFVLDNLETLPMILHVHIYKQEGSETSFFTSYNKTYKEQIINETPVIDVQFSRLASLSKPTFIDKYVEYIKPILNDESLIGYIYIRLSSEEFANFKQNILLAMIGFVILSLISCFVLATKLKDTFISPLGQLIAGIQQISQKRDYANRVESMPFQELDILSRNINILLSRTEKYIEKQANAEQQVLQLNQELEDKVSHRTNALKESNQELLSTLEKLHQFQGQLVESEKMASLGDMVAGVAHEVNTPIGLGVTASSLLSDKLDEIKSAFEDKTLKSSQLKKFLGDSEENVAIIYRNLKRAADLISSFKKVAVDQSSEVDREFNFKDLLNEVLLTLAPELKNKHFEIKIDCPKDLTVLSKPGPINQILINLIINSIIHGFENRDHGIISISVKTTTNQLHLSYKDNGKGVDSTIKAKIFDPFTTTKRGEGGSGLGLHLVYNLVTQALRGNIQFESETDQGVSFEINFPI